MNQITTRLKSGQDLKAEIKKLVAGHNIKAGVLVSLVGGLSRAKLRMPGATPEKQIVKEWNEPLEVVSATGTLSQDGNHIHVSLSDKDGNVIGGHLKDGCIVETTAEVVILVFDDTQYKRKPDPQTKFKELTID